MGNFDLMNEICGKIAEMAIDIGKLDVSISELQDKGYKNTAELYVNMQLTELDQLQNLVLFLSNLLIPESGDKSGNKSDDDSERDDEEDGERIISAGYRSSENKNNPENARDRTNTAIRRDFRQNEHANPVVRKAGYTGGKR
jgi:hypothetical protein